MSLAIRPITLRKANEFVLAHHRHHGVARGHRFSVAVERDGQLVGVAIAGRPVSRHLDDGTCLEVLRLCTDGTRNAASKLLGAVRRIALAWGFRRVVTYTLEAESGASLRGAGWRCVGHAGGGSWSRKGRPREDKHPLQLKLRWEAPGIDV